MAHFVNARERNTTFWKFLAFFMLSTLLVVSAVYFDTRIPAKDNAIMKEQIGAYKTQALAQEKFVRNMDEAKALIDSLTRPGSNSVYLNQQIAAKIRELAQLQYKDSSMYSRLNKNVLDVFLRYQEATNKAASVGDLPRQLDDYRGKYEQAQRDLDNTRRDLDVLRRSNTTGQGAF
jgi:Type VI secretion system, TssO